MKQFNFQFSAEEIIYIYIRNHYLFLTREVEMIYPI